MIYLRWKLNENHEYIVTSNFFFNFTFLYTDGTKGIKYPSTFGLHFERLPSV